MSSSSRTPPNVNRGKRSSINEEDSLTEEQSDTTEVPEHKTSKDLLNIPGARTYSSQTEEDQGRLGARVTFSNRRSSNGNDEAVEVTFHIDEPDGKREQWKNKMQYYMAIVSYAVGLGNVWRFPYLCQKNGGGAFLIPYVIMMGLLGLPLFLIELGIGQRLRTGPIGVWNAIHPYLGGLGVSAAIVSYFVALYYNVIITWCLFYLGSSFDTTLPWAKCPDDNGTIDPECAMSSSTTMYFWSRKALDTTGSIGEIGGLNEKLLLCLFIAWLIVYLCVMRGIKTSGNVMYITATFPYVVTTMFFVRCITLEGSVEGLIHMFKPDMTKLYSPTVWLEAATQIFYSMGLGFGGLIAFGSYNPIKNNVVKDVIQLGIINGCTSLYTAAVVFSVLGYMAHNNMDKCIINNVPNSTLSVYPPETIRQMMKNVDNLGPDIYEFVLSASRECDYDLMISEAAEGTGLAFVVFTEAMLKFPFPPMWSQLFFSMLLALGLGSMFGTLEGVITSLNDSKIITVSKPILTLVLCGSALCVGMLFATRSGQYWVSLFDSFAGSYALMCVAFFELIAVVYVYGYHRFSNDIEYMTGIRPNQYWLITWRFISPAIMLVLFVASVIQCFSKPLIYYAYEIETGKNVETSYPIWAMFLALAMVIFAIMPTFAVWFLRYFRIWRVDPDIPTAAKCLNQTPSTTYMLKSEQSFNRMTESSVSFAEESGNN